MIDTTFLNALGTVPRDFINLFLGTHIGTGAAREVFVCRTDPTIVIKIEQRAQSFQNIKEWEIWNDVQYDKKLSPWFVPCVDISNCGTVLIQKRAEHIPKAQFPKKIPACFGDLKYENFGVYKNHFVCLDYGTITTSNGLRGTLKKASWWQA